MFYFVFKEMLEQENGNKYETYGIRHHGGFEIHDVSLNFENITALVKKLNFYNVNPQYVLDIIEDFAGEDF